LSGSTAKELKKPTMMAGLRASAATETTQKTGRSPSKEARLRKLGKYLDVKGKGPAPGDKKKAGRVGTPTFKRQKK
jgi:hypothetical protein